MIVLQHAAESLSTFDLNSDHAEFAFGLNDLIAEPLMISFPVIMRNVLADSPL